MTGLDIIYSAFPELSESQKVTFAGMKDVYREWNDKINVISRKDFDNFYLHHVLHSLAIARFMHFAPKAKVLDVGCGGGFPSIPLAVMFPEVEFTAVDSIQKKIRVVEGVACELHISNIVPINSRVEALTGKFDYIVSRAVTNMPAFISLIKGKGMKGHNGSLENGIIYLKGGDLEEELRATGRSWEIRPIKEYFDDPFFETKHIVYSAF